jgi:hypothetical protein
VNVRALCLVLLLCVAWAGYACGGGNTVKGTGTIRYLDVEDGFYGIVADDGNNYDPINLSSDFADFQEDGLRVTFECKVRDDLDSIHMWGTIIELTAVEKL